MRTLNIRAEINGKQVPIGTITGNTPSDARFQYFPDYCHNPSSAALSISFPLQKEPFSPAETACFFEGLLPEGFTRQSVSQWMHVDEGDYLSILHGLGRECLGAICVSEGSEHLETSYEPITAKQVQELAAEGAVKSAELVTKTHLSLAGASGKVGLYYDENDNVWYLPHGAAPSTHIVKQSHIYLDSVVLNEQIALRTAARCGIMVSPSFIINTGKGRDHEVLFATKRFDRVFSNAGDRIGGLPRPFRLHQEDFAQAMGIPATQKYENNSALYMKRMFENLRIFSADPIADMISLWDRIVFNCLIGNTDAHVKNFSLLYSIDWKRIRLAPAYDIISTTIYEQSTRNLAFCIGGAASIDEIGTKTFQKAAHEVGLGERIAMQRVEQMCGQFSRALIESADEMAALGYAKAHDIKDRILQTGGIRNLR